MNRLVFITLWILAFSIPWANMFVFEEIGTVTKVVGIIVFSIAALYVVATGKIRKLRLHFLGLALFVLWAFMSYFWSLAPDLTLTRIWTYLQLLVMVWLIWQFAGKEFRYKSLMQAYVLGAYIPVASTVINYLSRKEVDPLRYAASGWGPNDLGIVLALGIPISWYLVMVNRRTLLVWANCLYIPLAAIAILLTSSRTAVIAALIALLIIPWTFSKLAQRERIILLIGIITVSLVILFIIPMSSWERLSTIPTEVTEGSLNLREDIWRAGLTVFGEHPIQGIGSGAFKEAIEPIFEQRVAHNVFLSILTENGIIGFMFFIFIAAFCLSAVLKMKTLEKRIWLILISTWIVGAFFLSWEHRHPTWFFLGLLFAQAFATNTGDYRLSQSKSVASTADNCPICAV